MRDYSKVSPQFWIGSTGKKLRAQGIECQLVALYLMTCSHANMLGMYYLPKVYIAHECGLTLEGASKGLQCAIESGFCAYEDASEVVWVYEMATYQIGEQLKEGDLRVKGVQNEYNIQPESLYLKPFFDKYKTQFLMTCQRGIEAPNKPLVSQEQEQEHKQEQEQKQEHEQDSSSPQSAEPPKEKTELQKSCIETWRSYANAYFEKYQTEPVRNLKVNAIIKQFVQRIGLIESPAVAAHYLSSNNAYYVGRGHSFDCLLADAEKMRTEWATGKTMTQTRASQIDKTQSNKNAVGEAMQLLGA